MTAIPDDRIKKISTGYNPRPLQKIIHKSMKRFNVLVLHRRFGKTVLSINESIDRALRCSLKSPQYAYIAPTYGQAKRIAWEYLKEYTKDIPGAKPNEAELRVDIPRPHLKDNVTANMHPKKTVMINRQEVAKLFKHLMPTDKNPSAWLKFAVVVTLAFTGLRLGELRALRWDRIDWILGKITINQAVVEGVIKDQVKADGSFDSVRMHSALFRVLSIWKSIQSKYYTPRKMPLVFASLKFVHETIPLADKTINDWLKMAYQDLGFAKIEVVKNSSGSKSHTRTVVNKFQGCVSKTFRHFAATSLTDAQAGNEILTDNFIKGQIRHKDIKLTKGLYGDHTGLDPSGERAAAEQEALDGAFPNLIDMEALNEN